MSRTKDSFEIKWGTIDSTGIHTDSIKVFQKKKGISDTPFIEFENRDVYIVPDSLVSCENDIYKYFGERIKIPELKSTPLFISIIIFVDSTGKSFNQGIVVRMDDNLIDMQYQEALSNLNFKFKPITLSSKKVDFLTVMHISMYDSRFDKYWSQIRE